jgi:hypothetical protein
MITVKSVKGQTVINLVNYGVYNNGDDGENSIKTPVKRQSNAKIKKEKKEIN